MFTFHVPNLNDKETLIKHATQARSRAVYAFKRDFFIRLGTQFEPSDLIKRANIYVDHLYPEVTASNAADYVSRTW